MEQEKKVSSKKPDAIIGFIFVGIMLFVVFIVGSWMGSSWMPLIGRPLPTKVAVLEECRHLNGFRPDCTLIEMPNDYSYLLRCPNEVLLIHADYLIDKKIDDMPTRQPIGAKKIIQ